MIVATLTGPDGQKVPVQKRRTVRMWADGTEEESGPAGGLLPPAPEPPDPAMLVEAIRLAQRVADHLTWQIRSLEYLPAGMADLALMGFRSVVGTDLPGTVAQVTSLRASLRAMVDGEPGAAARIQAALPEHRRYLEGLLAFGQIAVDGATRLLVPDEPSRTATREHLDAVGADLTELLGLLERLERPARSGPPAASSPPKGTP
jgi:hypothetical protein